MTAKKNTATKPERTLLFCDITTWQAYKSFDDSIFQILKIIEENHKRIFSKQPKDWSELLKDLENYFISNWWKENKIYYPPSMDIEAAFTSGTQIPLAALENLRVQYWALNQKLGSHAPVIHATEVSSGLHKDSFNRYLDESKREEYNTVVKLLNAVKELEKWDKSGGNFISFRHQIFKTYPRYLIMNSVSELEIRNTTFQE